MNHSLAPAAIHSSIQHRRSRLVAIAVAAIAIGGCGGAAAATSPTTTTTIVSPCTRWGLVDGSTFESAGTSDPTVPNPVTGQPSTPYFRTCGSSYHYWYVELGGNAPPEIGHNAEITGG
ncbi:MAG: hypothetical protein ABI894_08490 [Ilumatobacteraceae bacterium]